MAKRKSISKRRRFEIFKRDGFKCTYCGKHPPDVVLELDHIVPVAKGGDNSSENLTVACFDCNRGKSDVNLDQVIPQLEHDAELGLERLSQDKAYNRYLKAMRKVRNEQVAMIADAFTFATTAKDNKSIEGFLNQLGFEQTEKAVSIAVSRGMTRDNEWRYFCGVCWKKIKDERGDW